MLHRRNRASRGQESPCLRPEYSESTKNLMRSSGTNRTTIDRSISRAHQPATESASQVHLSTHRPTSSRQFSGPGGVRIHQKCQTNLSKCLKMQGDHSRLSPFRDRHAPRRLPGFAGGIPGRGILRSSRLHAASSSISCSDSRFTVVVVLVHGPAAVPGTRSRLQETGTGSVGLPGGGRLAPPGRLPALRHRHGSQEHHMDHRHLPDRAGRVGAGR